MTHSEQISTAAGIALTIADPVWLRLRREAEAVVRREPYLGGVIAGSILNHASFESVLAFKIGQRLNHPTLPGELITQGFLAAVADDPDLSTTIRADVLAVLDRDPVCTRVIEPVLYFKGFHALVTHRLAHWLWQKGRTDFALHLQSRSSEVFQTDINPAARFGRGIFLDHATGFVVGATAAIGDNVSILQEVTLGGTGKESGDRHPKVRDGVLIGAGAKILGNIEIGPGARIAAGSVVLHPVPANATVAGVPAKVIETARCPEPARSMDQILRDLPDD
ncbi:serine O-acetyltransferase [Pseudochelatococcus lubricantis]|uniref:Serine acetyltransferase n=1 Tax=Pseudochelatococcus lubricantis TaxID=1538102 RepID=A0ABX0V6E4_9HYPH|nr:serine O-acetyltransferase [Pseudochelatococcus lubricantis]NIJ59895.1 serine O-acetyltransferase [Pseudochelatococcus lubricantis]